MRRLDGRKPSPFNKLKKLHTLAFQLNKATMTELNPLETIETPAFYYEALVLAGGRGSRMEGKDKGWIMWNGHPLIEHVLDRIKNQTVLPQRITISANRNLDAYQQTGNAVLSDDRPGYLGPLAGVESALVRCRQPLLLVLPCDTPAIPLDLAERLQSAMSSQPSAQGAYATTADGPHPLCCLLKPSVGPLLSKFLDSEQGRIVDWLNAAGAVSVSFDDADAFANFNDATMLQDKDQ